MEMKKKWSERETKPSSFFLPRPSIGLSGGSQAKKSRANLIYSIILTSGFSSLSLFSSSSFSALKLVSITSLLLLLAFGVLNCQLNMPVYGAPEYTLESIHLAIIKNIRSYLLEDVFLSFVFPSKSV